MAETCQPWWGQATDWGSSVRLFVCLFLCYCGRGPAYSGPYRWDLI